MRYRHNWRLREMALESIEHLRSPTDRLLSEVLDILMDEGLYFDVRMLAARSLSALLSSNASRHGGMSDLRRSEVIKNMTMLLDSPQPPALRRVLRKCMDVIQCESRASCPEVILPGGSRTNQGREDHLTAVDTAHEEISWQGK